MTGGQIALFILASVLVILGAYYSTYFLAKRTGKMKAGRLIKLVDRFSLSKDKSICLIELKDKIYLVVVTSQSATLLDKIDIEKFETASVSQKGKPTSYKYEPQGMVQKGLWSAYTAIKDGIDKEKNNRTPTYEGKRVGQSHQTDVEADNLDLVYKKIQSRLLKTDEPDRKSYEEKDL